MQQKVGIRVLLIVSVLLCLFSGTAMAQSLNTSAGTTTWSGAPVVTR